MVEGHLIGHSTHFLQRLYLIPLVTKFLPETRVALVVTLWRRFGVDSKRVKLNQLRHELALIGNESYLVSELRCYLKW